MAKLNTIVKNFRRLDIGSMNSRIYIYDRDIQAPKGLDLNFTQKFTPKLACWSLLETPKGVSIFDRSNIERVISHIFRIRNVPYDSRINPPVYYSVDLNIISGLNDLTVSGTYSYAYKLVYRVQIDSVNTVDTFKWSIDDGNTWTEENISITGTEQELSNGVKITFANLNGHKLGDYWNITASSGIRISSQDWIFYQNQYMKQQSIFDILGVENMDEEGRFLNLLCALTGDQGVPANYA